MLVLSYAALLYAGYKFCFGAELFAVETEKSEIPNVLMFSFNMIMITSDVSVDLGCKSEEFKKPWLFCHVTAFYLIKTSLLSLQY